MPGRLIRQGFLDSEKINTLTEKEQIFFIRLMLVVDDFGHYDARPEMLRSQCYPISEIKSSEIAIMIKKLSSNKLIKLYNVDNKNYLEIINFNQRMRILKPKFPCPTDDGQMTDTCPTDDGVKLNLNRIEIETEIEEEKESEKKINLEHRACSELLKKRILEFKQQKITDKTLESWDNDVRLMIEQDERTTDQIMTLIAECHDMQPDPRTGFTWKKNILSMQKLRQQWNDGKIYIGINKKPVQAEETGNPYQKGFRPYD